MGLLDSWHRSVFERSTSRRYIAQPSHGSDFFSRGSPPLDEIYNTNPENLAELTRVHLKSSVFTKDKEDEEDGEDIEDLEVLGIVAAMLQISLNRTRRTLYVNFRYRRHIFLTANMYPSKGFARFTLEHDPRWWHMCPRDDQRYYTKTLMEDTEIRRIKESVDAMDDDGYGIQRWLAVLMWCAAMTLFNRNLWFKHRRFYQRTAMYARSKLFSSKGNPIEKYLVCFSGFDEHVSTMCLGRYYRVPVHGKIYFMVGVRRTRLLTYGQGQRMRRNLESLPSLDVPAFPRGPMEFIFHDHPRGAVLYNSSW